VHCNSGKSRERILNIYTTLFTTNGRKQKEKKREKKENLNNMYHIEKKKLDYDLTNIANSV